MEASFLPVGLKNKNEHMNNLQIIVLGMTFVLLVLPVDVKEDNVLLTDIMKPTFTQY